MSNHTLLTFLFTVSGIGSYVPNLTQGYLDNIGMRRLFSRLTLEGLLARLRFRRFCAII